MEELTGYSQDCVIMADKESPCSVPWLTEGGLGWRGSSRASPAAGSTAEVKREMLKKDEKQKLRGGEGFKWVSREEKAG
jgi:hypothetical protein